MLETAYITLNIIALSIHHFMKIRRYLCDLCIDDSDGGGRRRRRKEAVNGGEVKATCAQLIEVFHFCLVRKK
jgi:hypothetical protein